VERDMTKAQFDSECRRRGFRSEGVLGYYRLPGGVCVSVLNAGSRRRDWLAYLIRAARKAEERLSARRP
jgi:hypothetical protein